jgi:hypothetical protein
LYLLSNSPGQTSIHGLLCGIRTIAAGEALLAPSVTRRLIAHFTDRNMLTRPRFGDSRERTG